MIIYHYMDKIVESQRCWETFIVLCSLVLIMEARFESKLIWLQGNAYTLLLEINITKAIVNIY